MFVRRQLWEILAPFLAPLSFGVLAWRSGRRIFAAVQFTVSVASVLALGAVATGGRWAGVATDPLLLTEGLIAVGVIAVVSVGAVLAQCRDTGVYATGPFTRLSGWAAGTVAAALIAGACASAFWVAVPQIEVARRTFVSAPVAVPHSLAPAAPAASLPPRRLANAASSTSTTTTTLPPAPERFNLLLLGGDAAPGRYGLRTDSVNLVSIDPTTGEAAMVGIPRNLQDAPLPPGPLADEFPDGFTDLFNALYGWGERRADIVEEALGPTDAPGASLVAASAAELLGVRIDAWILIDMAGFIEIIDAFGGLDVYVPKALPAAGNVAASRYILPPEFTPGWQRMDGTAALSFARSRKADSDYRRMARQRCLLASLAAQNDQLSIARVWPSLSAVVSDRVRTNLTGYQLTMLTGLAGLDVTSAATVGLIPPAVPASGWDPVVVRRIVATAIWGPGAGPVTTRITVPGPLPTPPSTLTTGSATSSTPSGASTTTSASTMASTTTSTVARSTTTTTVPSAESVGDVCRTVRPAG